jgi:hypothetical protein
MRYRHYDICVIPHVEPPFASRKGQQGNAVAEWMMRFVAQGKEAKA